MSREYNLQVRRHAMKTSQGCMWATTSVLPSSAK